MMARRSRVTRLGVFAAAVLIGAGCAPTGRLARPAPFPAAPLPPAAPARTAAPALPEPVVDQIVRTALDLRGVPYRLGGEEPSSGFDCSGLVWYVFDQAHVPVPRTVAEQYLTGQPVQPDDIRAGDLLFFRTTASGPSHVGIALGSFGDGEFIHAPTENGVVRIERFDTPYWRSRLIGVRRIAEK
jgi:cell wall-associated NlpC family hydrolase